MVGVFGSLGLDGREGGGKARDGVVVLLGGGVFGCSMVGWVMGYGWIGVIILGLHL